MKNTTSAVVMGDLISSTEFENQSRLYEIFNNLVDQSNVQFKKKILSPLTITLGDEFQGITTSLEDAFEITHFIRLNLLRQGIPARFVIGEVSITSNINHLKAWNMLGSGLSEAREKLNNKDDWNAYRFSFPNRPEIAILLDAIGLSLTHLELSWKSSQLNYVVEAINHSDSSINEISKSSGVSANSFYKALRSADYNYYIRQISTIKLFLNKFKERK